MNVPPWREQQHDIFWNELSWASYQHSVTGIQNQLSQPEKDKTCKHVKDIDRSLTHGWSDHNPTNNSSLWAGLDLHAQELCHHTNMCTVICDKYTNHDFVIN